MARGGEVRYVGDDRLVGDKETGDVVSGVPGEEGELDQLMFDMVPLEPSLSFPLLDMELTLLCGIGGTIDILFGLPPAAPWT